MPIKVTCTKCQGVLLAPDDAGGKRGKCPTCGAFLAIPVQAGTDESRALGSNAGLGGGGARSSESENFRAPAPAPVRASAVSSGAEEARRSAFSAERDPGAEESRRPPRVPPAPPADPFARASARAEVPTAGEVRAFRKARGGFGTVGFGYTLLLISVAARLVVPMLPELGVQVPVKDPGFLGQQGLNSGAEIFAGAVGIPAALGVLCILFGRLGATRLPALSGARGTEKLSLLFTLLTVAGLVAYAAPTGAALFTGAYDLGQGLLPNDEPSGIAQRVGLALAAVCAPVAEMMALIGAARLGSGLRDSRLTARSTRYLFYVAFIFTVVSLASYAVHWYGWDAVVGWINKTGVVKTDAPLPAPVRQYGESAGYGVAALSLWLILTRLQSGARRAIRVWLDHNA